LAGTLIFFIRWQDRWYEAHANEEFRFKRLDLDVDGASWLVEMMLEWRGVEGPISRVTLSTISRTGFLIEYRPVRCRRILPRI